jgi:hypothetical protein
MVFNRLIVVFVLVLGTIHPARFFAQSIADARLQAEGATVTVRGIVTSGPELGKIRYLQDGTAGIAAYPGTGSMSGFEDAVTFGDSIEVTGTLVDYYGLLEITPISSYSVISKNNPLPAPKLLSFSSLSEEFESQLVEFDCVAFSDASLIFSNSGAYTLTDPEGKSAKVYLRSGHPMIGDDIPVEPIRLRAILSDFFDFQLLPRTVADFAQAACFYFAEKPSQSEIDYQGFKLDWETSVPTDCVLRLGTTPNPDQSVPITGYTTNHSLVLTNLQPGTIYWVQIEAMHDGQSILSEPIPFATRSLSSGEVKTYFNHDIDFTVANGNVPNGETSQAVLLETIARIDLAQQTLDVAVYNNNRDDIIAALEAAHARGVRVRYVAALDATNAALDPAPNFPVIFGNSTAIMHNKFMVVDADLPDKAWVMGGSMNWTNQNINSDYNNTLFIQDQSLARAYEIEFEEMWGGEGTQPNAQAARFGSAKLDNTPHSFIVGGYPLELYFSPSDQTTSYIEAALRSAQSEALFATFSFTKNELGNALVEIHDTGVPVRGIMENISDVGAEYNHLLNNGVDVRHHNLSGEFHHKYAVIDAYDMSSDPTVVTGSHNWSVSAETINDENTLILHDPVLAALFKAEFEQRWGEFPVTTINIENQYFTIYPNPASNLLSLQQFPAVDGLIFIKNALGQVLLSEKRAADGTTNLDISRLAPGQYFVTLVSPHGVVSVPFQKI